MNTLVLASFFMLVQANYLSLVSWARLGVGFSGSLLPLAFGVLGLGAVGSLAIGEGKSRVTLAPTTIILIGLLIFALVRGLQMENLSRNMLIDLAPWLACVLTALLVSTEQSLQRLYLVLLAGYWALFAGVMLSLDVVPKALEQTDATFATTRVSVISLGYDISPGLNIWPFLFTYALLLRGLSATRVLGILPLFHISLYRCTSRSALQAFAV